MSKDLVVTKNTSVSLSKTKNLLKITTKILTKTTPDWAIRLWEWADEKDIDETEISRNFQKLRGTEQIILVHRGIEEIPVELFNLTEIKKFIISHDTLRSLPSEIMKLKKLITLDLSYNVNLTEIPDTVCDLSQLEELNLSSSNIKNLPKGIDHLTKLKILNVSFCKISSMPENLKPQVNIYYES